MNNSYSVKTYLKSIETPLSLRFDYIIALIPLIISVIIRFNISAILFSAAIISVSISDIILKSIYNKKLSLPSIYTIYAAIVFVLTLYPTTSIYIAILGAVLISIFTNLLGGEENCFIFTPLISRIIVFSILLQHIHIPQNLPYNNIVDGILPEQSTLELFIGTSDGNLYTASAAALLMGAIYLLIRKTLDFKACSAYLMVSTVLSFIFPMIEGRAIESLVYEYLTGGIIFVAFFVLTDMSSTPVNSNIRYLKGVLCAILTFVYKVYVSSYDPLDCYYTAVVATDVIVIILCILSNKIKIAKEMKNEK